MPLLEMWHSSINLLRFTWNYLVTVFGLNTLYIAIFTIIIPILIFISTAFHKLRQERETGINMRQIIKESLFTPKTMITGGIYILALILLFSWGITYTTYKDHEDLKNRIRNLHKENENYKKDTSKDDEIKKLKTEVEKLKKDQGNQTKLKKYENKIYTLTWTNVTGKNQIPDKDIPIDIRNVRDISIEGSLLNNTQPNRNIKLEVLTSAIENGIYIHYHSQDLDNDGTFNFGLTEKPGFMKLRLHVNDGKKVNCKGIVSVTYY